MTYASPLSVSAGRGDRSTRLGHSKGFTIVELLVTMTLIGISTALALPSYQDLVEKRRVTQGAEQIAVFINATQVEAIRRNQQVTISYDRVNPDDWCFGAVVGSVACDCMESDPDAGDYCQIDDLPRFLTDADMSSFDFMDGQNGDGAFSFEPVRGLMVDTNDAFTIDFRSASSKYKLKLQVSAAGQVRLCSGDSNHMVPGFDLCGAAVAVESPEAES